MLDGLVYNKIGYAIEFDGANDYFTISLNEKFEYNSATLLAIVKMKDNNKAQTILQTDSPYLLVWRPSWDLSGVYFVYYSGRCVYVSTKIKQIANSFNCLGGSYKVSDKIYIKTLLNKSVILSGQCSNSIGRPHFTKIFVGGSSPYFKGQISAILIYTRELKQNEINNILTNYPNISKKDLYLWLDARAYDETAKVWYDLSGNNNNAVVAGGSPKKIKLKEVVSVR